jgi:predicted RNA binding protein YcfA (HicA-like mRNA interferase family)
MGKPRTYREVVKILRRYDPRFEVLLDRGKGSERVIYHPDINGRPASIPVKCHGEGTELRKGIISAILRRFNLPKDLL